MGYGAIIRKVYTGDIEDKWKQPQILYEANIYKSMKINSKPFIQIKSKDKNLFDEKINELLNNYHISKENVIKSHSFIKHFDYDIFILNLETGEILE